MSKTGARKGFTIIEVVLVLAIAGLIFLMVFIALPALQRGQRNTQRKNDLSRILTAFDNYRANNSNKHPFPPGQEDTWLTSMEQFTKRYIDENCGSFSKAPGDNTLFVPDSCGAQFSDPDGEPYRWDVRADNWWNDSDGDGYTDIWIPVSEDTVGSACDGTWCVANSIKSGSITHYISVFDQAECTDREGALRKTNKRNDIALVYRLEGGAITCVDN
ncbi:type II secretion system protein [Candidatus Saccharibacteria bacterium]|nr:type II secretion system protein [Candidatus Saccharibacteria bacterium]